MTDMRPEAVSARLRAACRGPRPSSRVPMDPASVSARLRTVSELRDLCLKLGRGRVEGSASDPTMLDAVGSDQSQTQT